MDARSLSKPELSVHHSGTQTSIIIPFENGRKLALYPATDAVSSKGSSVPRLTINNAGWEYEGRRNRATHNWIRLLEDEDLLYVLPKCCSFSLCVCVCTYIQAWEPVIYA